MNKFLDLLLSRHRRFKGQTYFRNYFPLMLVISFFFSLIGADSYISFFLLLGLFLFVDIILAVGAWLYFPTDL